MKKSGSCPNLQASTASTPLSPVKYAMKKSGSSQNIVTQAAIDQANIEHVFPQMLSPDYEITRITDKGQEYFMAMTAPAHVVGICMLEYPDGAPGISTEERNKNLASCIASPCDVEECPVVNFDGIRRNMYMLANENRAGELFSRIRRFKRDQKG